MGFIVDLLITFIAFVILIGLLFISISVATRILFEIDCRRASKEIEED